MKAEPVIIDLIIFSFLKGFGEEYITPIFLPCRETSDR